MSFMDLVLARIDELDLRPQPRDDHRSITDYPRMPPRTCNLSPQILAEIYPELSVICGRLTWRMSYGQVDISHAWNVTPDGTIFDSTWEPPDGAEDIEYRPEEDVMTTEPAEAPEEPQEPTRRVTWVQPYTRRRQSRDGTWRTYTVKGHVRLTPEPKT